MPVAFLYITVVLIWGTTWVTIPYQLGFVAEEWSIAYRFGIGSFLLFAYAHLTGKKITIARKQYPLVALMGSTLFSINYLFVYYGAGYMPSGLIAVLFSLIVVFNGIFERVFFGRPFEARMQIAAIVGIGGISLVFWPEVAGSDFGDQRTTGVLWVLLAVVIAALANMMAIINTRHELSVVIVNAHAMGWGAMTSILIALVSGRPMAILLTPEYLWSLLYLSIFGSSIAFVCYLSLLKRIGAARAAFSSVLFPIVALLMSTFFEDFQWTRTAIIGIALTLAGNWLALTKTNAQPDSTK